MARSIPGYGVFSCPIDDTTVDMHSQETGSCRGFVNLLSIYNQKGEIKTLSQPVSVFRHWTAAMVLFYNMIVMTIMVYDVQKYISHLIDNENITNHEVLIS